MNKLLCVVTGKDGRAAIGTIPLDRKDLNLHTLGQRNKSPHERADPHHPQSPILLAVRDGSHTIYAAGDGRTEQSIELEVDDYILFVDFAPLKRPNDNLRFSYTGHWSQAGMWGATLEPHEVHGLDLNTLEWTPGIPE